MKAPIFKIRCSAIGKIMTGTMGLTATQEAEFKKLSEKEKLTPNQEESLAKLKHKKENPELSQTTISYLESWMKAHAFGVDIEFSNKYTDKGNRMEGPALAHLGLKKNDQSFEDDYFTGDPDAIDDRGLEHLVRDIKNSYSHNTFPMYAKECPNKDYWWQLQGYMHLTGIYQASLDYFLLTDPEDENGYNYDHVSINSRIKSFRIEYDPEAIMQVIERVKLCRKYVQEHYIYVELEEDVF